jgi:hypothetical protein
MMSKRPQGSLPSNIDTNLMENISAITLRDNKVNPEPTLTTYATGSSEYQTDKIKETPKNKKNDEEVSTASSKPIPQGIRISIPTKKPTEPVKANPIPPTGGHKKPHRPQVPYPG